MKVLFSPIGKTDPMTRCGDAAMLNIARHCRPEIIYLFLSPTIKEFDEKDNRYERSISLLAEELGIKRPEVIKVHTKETNSHRYDIHIPEFKKYLKKISTDYEDVEILLNITSGTPGMQHALAAIDLFGIFPTKAIQVSTPARGMNPQGSHEDPENFDLDTIWAIAQNKESRYNKDDRCNTVEAIHFSKLLLVDNLRTLVSSYDYSAAIELLNSTGGSSISEDAKTYLYGCQARLNLDYTTAAKVFGRTEFKYDPSNKLYEYLMSLEVRLNREMWADYLRAMTPAISATLFGILREKLQDNHWTTGKEGKQRIDISKVQKLPEVRKALYSNQKPPDYGSFVSNGHLLALIKHYYESENPNLIDKINKLRNLEKEARHPLAHSIVRIDKESLEESGGITLEKSFQILCELNDIKPGLYTDINKKILELIHLKEGL